MKFIKYAFGFLLLISLIVIMSFAFKSEKKDQNRSPDQPTVILEKITELSGEEVHQIALKKAQQWHPDAVLSYMKSGGIPATGRATLWELIFISPAFKNKGYKIEIDNREILSAQEMDYRGSGGTFPEQPKINQEEAIKKIKMMEGFKDAEILGVNAVYGNNGEIWYWGIETSKGVVSVKVN